MDVHGNDYNIKVEWEGIKLICGLDVSMKIVVGFCEYCTEQITSAYRSVFQQFINYYYKIFPLVQPVRGPYKLL